MPNFLYNTSINPYLLKIAEFIVNSDKTLPYRPRVEVAIFKEGKVLLTKNRNDDGNTWFGFPGGGTEGSSENDAAVQECLEEVGVRIKNLKRTDILHTQEGITKKDGREKQYRGSKTRVFIAEYDGKDDSKLGDDGDDVDYVWKFPEEARELLKKNDIDSSYRVEAIKNNPFFVRQRLR